MNSIEPIVFALKDLEQVEAESSNPYLRQPEAAMRLLASLLAAPALLPPGTDEMQAVRSLIDDGFGALAPAAGPSGAAVARGLAALRDGLQELVSFPDLANKIAVGFGGSFSAGKSRFLNTLLGFELLPEGLEPTTAVPTCLSAGAGSIRALNRLQRLVPIELAALQALAHGFDRQYSAGAGAGIGLAHLIKLLVIQDRALPWRNLALLDTPGFSKDDGQANSLADALIAREQLAQADHIVWLVSARNGSLRLDDIRFLQSVGHPRPVFFIVTQADLQADSAIPELMRSVEQAAVKAGIACAGVMAWSAPPGQRFGRIEGGADIHAWLRGLDLQPKLTDSRRTAARLIAGLVDDVRAAIDAGREELTVLNGFWSVAEQLPQETAQGLRQLLAARRAAQRQHGEQLTRIEEFGQALQAAIGALLEAVALADAEPVETIELRYQEAMLALRSRTSTWQAQSVFETLLDVACHGHREGQFALSECYRLGTGTDADAGLALRWCEKAASQGLAEAQFVLGSGVLENSAAALDPAALRWLESAAQQGHWRAQMMLFRLYAARLQEPDAPARAIAWLRLAAAQEFPEAEYELGSCYLHGIGLAKNRHKASDLYLKAAQRGYAPAQYEVGRAYQHGSDGPHDDAVAVRYFRDAAEQDHAEAQVSLGLCFLIGRGIGRNRAHAAAWFRRAQQLGEVTGTTGLGHCHFDALEFDIAVDAYRQAAGQGDAEARYRLGRCYLDGSGVRKNRALASHWMELALEQGYRPQDAVYDPDRDA